MTSWALPVAAQPAKIKVGILLPLTGTFAAVAETQRDGALLAIDVINRRGGLNMPGGRVMVEGVIADDEAKQDRGCGAIAIWSPKV
jgi:branched-chain amino acid transport system substrate-binding protein